MKSDLLRKHVPIFALVFGLTFWFTPFLLAQSDQQQSTEPKAEEQQPPKLTEEMTITARKKEETVQDSPISVAAPSGEELRDLGAQNIEDIAGIVPGFTVQSTGPGQTQVSMRGVGSGQIVRDQPGVKEQVGVYLDESVISLSLFTPDIDLFDLSRVEVLRGPQGTLFGSGSESGTLRYITNQPKIGVSESVGELTVDSISNGGTGGAAKFATNIPMGSTAASRIVAYYTRYGGFIDAVQPALNVKKDVNDGYRAGTRISLLFQPNDKLSITPRILYQKLDMQGWNRIDVFNILANPFTTTRPKVTFGDRETFTQFKEPVTDEFTLGDVNLNYNFGGGRTLTSITSYSDRDILVIRDATALTASVTGGNIGVNQQAFTINAPLNDKTKAKSFTQELRLSGNLARVQWVAGGFYARNKRDYGQHLPVTGFTAMTGIPTAGTKIAKTDDLYESDLHYKFKQFALFGEGTFSITPRFDVTGGLRYYDFKEDRTQIFDGIFADPIDSVGSTEATGVAPRVIASYKLSDTTRLNAQVSKGFRLGGINDPILVPLCTPADLATFSGNPTWDDETLWDYEVGSKSRILNNRGAFNVTAFTMDIEDLQATVTAGSCSSRLVLNVPKARSTGLEAEFEFAPTDNFDFSISASKSSSKLRSTLSAQGSTVPISGIRSGARMPTVPEEQVSAAATYRWQMNIGGGAVGYATGAYQHVGDRYTQVGDDSLSTFIPYITNNDTLSLVTFGKNTIGGPLTQNTFTFDPKLPAYDIVNFRIGFLKGRFDTALFVTNLTDERALLSLDRERGFRARVGYFTNQPRTIGITTRANF